MTLPRCPCRTFTDDPRRQPAYYYFERAIPHYKVTLSSLSQSIVSFVFLPTLQSSQASPVRGTNNPVCSVTQLPILTYWWRLYMSYCHMLAKRTWRAFATQAPNNYSFSWLYCYNIHMNHAPKFEQEIHRRPVPMPSVYQLLTDGSKVQTTVMYGNACEQFYPPTNFFWVEVTFAFRVLPFTLCGLV